MLGLVRDLAYLLTPILEVLEAPYAHMVKLALPFLQANAAATVVQTSDAGACERLKGWANAWNIEQGGKAACEGVALNGVFAQFIRKSMESNRIERLMEKLLVHFLKNPMSKKFESLTAAYVLHRHELPWTAIEMFWAAEAYGNLKSVGEKYYPRRRPTQSMSCSRC